MKFVAYDIEVYPDTFLVTTAREIPGGGIQYDRVECIHKVENDDIYRIHQMFKDDCVYVGFNVHHYDNIILSDIYEEVSLRKTEDIYKRSKEIIDGIHGYPRFDVNKKQTVDIKSFYPMGTSLKLLQATRGYGVFETPYDFNEPLGSDLKRQEIQRYCENDCLTILKLLKEAPLAEMPEIIRVLEGTFSLKAGIRFFKPGPALAEALFREMYFPRMKSPKIHKLNRDIKGGDIKHLKEFPDFVSPELNAVKNYYLDALIYDGDSVNEVNQTLLYADNAIDLGIGGIHGTNRTKVMTLLKSTEEDTIFEVDVASYYPNIIKNLKLEPILLTGKFSRTYAGMLEKRLKAKETGNKTVANAMKLVLNSVFGKTMSKYPGLLYNPEMGLTITIYGQLCMLKILEYLDGLPVEVIGLNTDGLFLQCKRTDKPSIEAAVAKWEKDFNFDLSYSEIGRMYMENINNYVIGTDSEITKTKGIMYNFSQKNRIAKVVKIGKCMLKLDLMKQEDLLELFEEYLESEGIGAFTMYGKTNQDHQLYLGKKHIGKIYTVIYSDSDLMLIRKNLLNERKTKVIGGCTDILDSNLLDYSRYVSDIDSDWTVETFH
ncbi:hypothetical protein UFOVP81_11 [uncultured Caudovirales phage]|uniref:Uncharacterized protein n=1 Tax=uncultured Caudovirales phage TaxID=2100421 RepID=A0A6J5L030_9CAUD|nr:hypothetical protein UFOVP81_11 [uncultured Caudovirales phage]